MLEITQLRDKCIGCNACVEASNSRWRISRKDGKSILIGGMKKGNVYVAVVDGGEYEANRKAVTNCPVKIIRLKQW